MNLTIYVHTHSNESNRSSTNILQISVLEKSYLRDVLKPQESYNNTLSPSSTTIVLLIYLSYKQNMHDGIRQASDTSDRLTAAMTKLQMKTRPRLTYIRYTSRLWWSFMYYGVFVTCVHARAMRRRPHVTMHMWACACDVEQYVCNRMRVMLQYACVDLHARQLPTSIINKSIPCFIQGLIVLVGIMLCSLVRSINPTSRPSWHSDYHDTHM